MVPFRRRGAWPRVAAVVAAAAAASGRSGRGRAADGGGGPTGGSRRGPLSTQNCAQGWRRGRPAVVALKSITGAVLRPGAPRHGTGTAREWPRNGTGTAQELERPGASRERHGNVTENSTENAGVR